MRIKRVFCLVIFILLSCAFTVVFAQIDTDKVVSVNGARYKVDEQVDYNELAYGVTHYTDIASSSTTVSSGNAAGLGGGGTIVPDQYYPQQVNVLEIPSSANTKIVSWSSLQKSSWKLSTVRAMAMDYERLNPGWKVIAAVNADFFDINANGALPYQTTGALVTNGDYYKTTGGRLIGFTNDGTANSLIGNQTAQRTDKMTLSVYNANDSIIKSFEIDKINLAPQDGEIAIYYGVWKNETVDGNTKKVFYPQEVTLGSNKGYFVNDAEKSLPNNETDFYGKGLISSISGTNVASGQFAIVTNNHKEAEAFLGQDVKIRAQYELTGVYANVDNVTGCGITILYNGVAPAPSDNNRHPRTVIGRKADGTIVMAVIDGRQPLSNMYGAVDAEMASMMQYYGCVDAYNLDGGGSSTMLIRDGDDFIVTNSPSDGRERTDSNCLLIVAKDPEFEVSVSDVTIDSCNLTFDFKNATYAGLYCEIDGKKYDIIQNQNVSITDLLPNTRYAVKVYIKDNYGEYMIVSQPTVTTCKRYPLFKYFEIVEHEKSFSVIPIYDDVDGALRAELIKININGRTFYCSGTEIIVAKAYCEEITDFSFEYVINIGDGNAMLYKRHTSEYHYTALYQMQRNIDNKIRKIFQ